MSLTLLLNSLVREAATLLAAVATHQGARLPVGNLTDGLFFGVADELHKRDVKRRVCADMFGMAPRAYLRKVRRVEESATESGRSLWGSVYEYIVAHGDVSWGEVSRRFSRDDHEILRGVLRDLTESGLVRARGRGDASTYSATPSSDFSEQALGRHVACELVWAIVYREGPLSEEELLRRVSIPRPLVDNALASLLTTGRVKRTESDGKSIYRSELFSPDESQAAGWEGAIFDHFHAVVKNLATFIRTPDLGTSSASTYTFDVGPAHPHAAEVKALFADLRSRASELRARIDSYNATQSEPQPERILLYLGMFEDT